MLVFSIIFFIFWPEIVISGCGYGDYNGVDAIPKPVITLHKGHISLYDELLAPEYQGPILAGQEYTLDIYMGNTDRYDYVIEKCFYNSRLSFLDNYGCLRKDDIFTNKWETDQYTITGALKRTLIHFIAPEAVAKFECQIKVIECCGCAERSCEQQPIIRQKSFEVPIMCSYPLNPPVGCGTYPCGGSGYGGGYGGYGGWNNGSFWNVIPWWLWLLVLFLLLILLFLIVCALCFCFMKKRGTHASRGKTYPPAPPPIAPKPHAKTDGAVQTLPEMKQIGQQVNLDKKKHMDDELRQRQMSSYDAVSLVDYNPRPEPKTVVHTIYANEETEYRDRRYDLDQDYVNLAPANNRHYHQSSDEERRHDEFRRYGGVPLHRGATHYQQQQLQHEIEEHLRREHERQEMEERIETHLSEHREHRERRHFAHSPSSGETVREETVRTMRQSSVI